MKNGKRKITIVSTKRNKGLEPMLINNIGTMGYDPEIHGEDSIEYVFKLPIGAIKRVIKSYFEEIKSIDEEMVYYAQTGSWNNRMYSYANRMLLAIEKQLNRHNLNGIKIRNEIYDQYFKKDYFKMDRFYKNHGTDVMETFKPCKDLLCCNYTNNLFIKIRVVLRLFFKTIRLLKGNIPSTKPYIAWH